jgi:hypothetical protein
MRAAKQAPQQMERGVMRRAIWATIVAALLFGLYWGAAALALRTGAEALLAAMRRDGSADVASLDVAGFPQRFSLHLTAPQVQQGLWGWSGKDLRLSAPAYAPLRMHLDLPDEQQFRYGWMEFSLQSRNMQAALSLVPGVSLAVASAEIAADALRLRAADGASVEADVLRLRLASTETPAIYQLQAELLGLHLPEEIAAAQGFPARADAFNAELALQLSAPLDRFAGSARPQLAGLQVESASLRWGDAELRATGSLTITTSGQPEGRLMLQTGDWRAVFALAVALGMVQRDVAPTFEALLAKMQGEGGALTIPLEFRLGWVFLGPVPLGPAPYLQ